MPKVRLFEETKRPAVLVEDDSGRPLGAAVLNWMFEDPPVWVSIDPGVLLDPFDTDVREVEGFSHFLMRFVRQAGGLEEGIRVATASSRTALRSTPGPRSRRRDADPA